MSSRPSPHISWSELACKDGTAYPLAWRNNARLKQLCNAFESIRSACGGKPIVILSAYRTAEHNRKVGGARNSQHLLGYALDLKPPKGMSVDKFYKIIKEIALYFPALRGIGKYRTFVHIDVRDAEKIAYWSGTGTKDA